MTRFANLRTVTNNIGDEIQALAALQFLPATEVTLIDRDRIATAAVAPGTKLILNGWWMHEPAEWPPPAEIEPLIIGFHATRRMFGDGSRLAYIRDQSRRRPAGARDHATLAMFREAGVDAYWSGCLTLSLRMTTPSERNGNILAIDLDDETVSALRRRTERPIIEATQEFAPEYRGFLRRAFRRSFVRNITPAERFRIAKERLVQITTAEAVVTGRLHVALPSLALGTPVLFVTHRPDDPRLETWLQYFRWCTRDDFIAGRVGFDLTSPPENDAGWRDLGAAIVERCEAFTGQRMRSFQDVVV